ncbi:tRNA threonylcarbamoyladenosine biosynthesis protein TsaE [Staphylococcus auricularis]|uniref:tRNA threonylcarbamoyladenosine biosynthesis protein TsaE n=2 Tax=Bacteria TaxID=2 RepID=A0AAW7M6W5_9STAP|nr:tRNA (adenosine(37)-N6)-threonylcarbamoyltransferase complex ATPase subunit type 1 TsaE [Staphylococcus auricularis]MBM0868905.1 tRNA (adenosine(37)-N6)-threonylcarbamoyltransferase complex ATPase subunit type 1 TsaE [Staphylococcus auricularis]MDC6328021.1 tRNA (adenosine(37)-N6)-threonylcarbamoyltransferase complex ATPase subunit type 1 TsaE [Staphylococcus auricularis]MDN4532127.1 tRNA (adenosine(37)-N6)-threonylcarbamoyltransferase complex ATPase subunit type 1 TsaE [Staphylococcus auricu
MIEIHGLDEMERFGTSLASKLSAGDVLLLEGDLGAGKTTLSQKIGAALGVKRNINSPTFNIIKSYNGDTLKFHHMDCYRLEESDEDLGFEEYFNDEAVTVIEWSRFIKDYLPPTYMVIHIQVESETARQITLEAQGTHYEQIKESLLNELSTD